MLIVQGISMREHEISLSRAEKHSPVGLHAVPGHHWIPAVEAEQPVRVRVVGHAVASVRPLEHGPAVGASQHRAAHKVAARLGELGREHVGVLGVADEVERAAVVDDEDVFGVEEDGAALEGVGGGEAGECGGVDDGVGVEGAIGAAEGAEGDAGLGGEHPEHLRIEVQPFF